VSWQARLRVELYEHRASLHDPAIARFGADAVTKRLVAMILADAVNDVGAPLRGVGRREIARRTGLTLDAVARAVAYLEHDDGLLFVVKPGGPARPAWYGIALERCPKDLDDHPQARVPDTRESSELVYVSNDRDARARNDRGARVPGTRGYYMNENKCAGARDDPSPPPPVDKLPLGTVHALLEMGAEETGWKPRRPRASVADREHALAVQKAHERG